MNTHYPNQDKVVAFNIMSYFNVACFPLLFSNILSIFNLRVYTLAKDLLILPSSLQGTLADIFYTIRYMYSEAVSPEEAI